MKFTILALALTAIAFPTLAQATMLERQAGRAIRQAGHWCDKVSHMAVNEKQSLPSRRVVRVTCDDGTRYVQYDLTMRPDNKIASIEKAKP
jgi:flagellar basal body-associated protein FliL